MKSEHAKMIVNAAEMIPLDVTLREDYSGRGMSGDKTCGVVGSMGDLFLAVATAAHEVGLDGEDGEDFLVAVGQFTFDNMGRNLIAY